MVQTSITLDSLDLEIRLTQYLFRCGIILFLKIHFGNKNYYENLAIYIYTTSLSSSFKLKPLLEGDL